jgi:hypothetical protein
VEFFPLVGGELMSEGKSGLSSDKKEERDPLARVVSLAPLLALILQALELMLKALGVIK